MGCKSSKLLIASVELGDKPRRSRANLKLDLIQYLPNEPLELPAPHHGDVIPDKKTAGGAAAAAAAAARSPRSPALTPAMTPHAEEEPDPAVPATIIIVQQCSVASDDASEAGLLDSEAELPGTRTKVCSSHGDSVSLSRRDSNETVSTEGRGDHNSKRRRRESGSEGEGERADGGGDKKRSSPAAGVAHGDNTQDGDGATCITASAITIAAVEAVSETSSPAKGRPSPSRSYSDSSSSGSSSSNSDSPATTTTPTPPTAAAAAAAAAAVAAATFDPLPPITGELLLFLEKYRRPDDSNRPADEQRQEEEAGEKGGEGGMGVVVSLSRVHLPGGRTYEGQLRRFDGLPQGWGSVTLEGGDMYEGSWLGGRVHGKGALRLQNGNVYWGSWAYGRKHGLGTFTWSDGSRYDGYYKTGERSGAGTLRYATGAVYKGDFLRDLKHGVGRLELPNGAVYDGDWEGDVPHGYGVYVDASEDGGERFEGGWSRGLRCGGGKLTQGWAEEEEEEAAEEREGGGARGVGDDSGNIEGARSCVGWYSGNFEAGLPHGDGMMGYGKATYFGHIEQGEWTGGGGRIDPGDGVGTFEGMWLEGLPRGGGRWRCDKSGAEVDCTFEEGHSKKIWPR